MSDSNRIPDPDFNSEIIAQIKLTRNQRGLTQKQLAAYMHITEQQYKDMETGRTPVDVERLRRFCEYFKMHVLDVMPESPETKKVDLDLGDITDDYKSLSKEAKAHVDWMIKTLAKSDSNK